MTELDSLKKNEKLIGLIYQSVKILTSTVILFSIFYATILLVRKGKVHWFEIKILVCFSIIAVLEIITNIIILVYSNDNMLVLSSVMYYVLLVQYYLTTFAHFTYALQYLKTCHILPRLVYKAKLIVERHQTVIENDYEITTLRSTYIQRHEMIDEAI